VKPSKPLAPIFVVRNAVTADSSPWSSAERWIAVLVAGFMDGKGLAWPSVDRLRRQSGLGRRTVERGLARLCGPGGLFIEKQGGSSRDGGRRASEYRLRTPATGTGVPPPQRRRLKPATPATNDTRPPPQTTRTPATVAPQQTIEQTSRTDQRETPATVAGVLSPWPAIAAELARSMRNAPHEAVTWLRPLEGSVVDGVLVVRAPGQQHLDWLNRNLERVEAAAVAANVDARVIRFERSRPEGESQATESGTGSARRQREPFRAVVLSRPREHPGRVDSLARTGRLLSRGARVVPEDEDRGGDP